MTEISSNKSAWDFNTTLDSCNNILSLSNAFQDYITEMEHRRAIDLNQFCDVTVSSLGINSRIRKISLQNNILMVSQLIKLLDSGVHLDGLGHKSLKILNDKVESFGIKISSVNDDLNFIFNILDIKCDANTLKGIYEVTKKFKIPYSSFSWSLGRQELQRYIDIQSQIAHEFIDKFSEKSYNTLEYLSLLRKDDESIYLPGPYFFITINKNKPPFAY